MKTVRECVLNVFKVDNKEGRTMLFFLLLTLNTFVYLIFLFICCCNNEITWLARAVETYQETKNTV